MKPCHVHEGRTPTCKPLTFHNCLGEPAKDVPNFACKKFVSGKKYAALALCISLWMAGGGVAGATNLYLDADDNITPASGYPEGATVEKTAERTLSVSGGTWNRWDITGGTGSG